MKRLLLIAAAIAMCTRMAHAAEQSPSCTLNPRLPLKMQAPIADLSGGLPVADYLDAVIDCAAVVPGAAENEFKPKSDWVEGDALRYREFLAQSKFDWLVLPAQTQYYGFDRIERALIGAEVADALGDRASLPDTLLVARALGEVRRRYDYLAVSRLAEATGAKHLIEVYAGHDGNMRMTLTLLLKECGSQGGCKLVKQRDWRNLAFSNELPPFRVVHEMQGAIRSELLGMPGALTAAPRATDADPGLAVAPPKLLAPAFRSSAATVTLLAALAPSYGDFARERLNIWALRSALNAGNTAEARFLAASAAKDLYRRPYALKLIEGFGDPAANTLRALLNGNLTEAQAGLDAVRAPLPKLLLAMNVQRLGFAYGRKTDFDLRAIAGVFGSAAPEWSSLVTRRITDTDLWKPVNSLEIKQLLDSAFPVAGLNLRSIMQGSPMIANDEDSGDLDTADIRHLRAALGKLKAADCCAGAEPRSAAWQLYWLLEASTDANVMKRLWRLIQQQGLPEQALRMIERYQAFYGGNPPFEMARGVAATQVGARVAGDKRPQYDQQFEKSERVIAYWAQGQAAEANATVHRGTHLLVYADAYSRDFPRRSYWSMPIWGTAGATKRLGCVSLEYSTADLTPVEFCLSQTPEVEKPKLLASLRNRFHGNPAAASLGSDPVNAADKPVDDIERLRAAIRADPTYENYDALGVLLVQRFGRYQEAQKIFLEYPEFKVRDPEESVALSNASYLWGSSLYWQGQPDLARPLYQISADLDTGSEASITSAARLALLDGDFASAIGASLARATRYSSPYAYRDYLSLLYAMGEGEEAHNGFLQIANRFENPQPWHAELTGQRMRGMTYEQMKGWVLGDAIRNSRYRGRRFAASYATIWATTDRVPSADFPRLMEQIERDAVRTIDSERAVARPSVHTDTGLELVAQSSFRAGKAPALPEGTRVKSEYVLLADALTSLHAADYGAAVEKFTALADRYPIERDYTQAAMAYFALAAAKSGDKIGLEKYIESLPWADNYFDVWMARAFFAAVRHDPAKAASALQRAFLLRPHTDLRPILTEYQFAEACEIVGRETGDPRFYRMAVDWARRNQRIQPTQAWSYAIEASYSKVDMDVTRALAMTLYLDPQSPRLKKFDARRIATARAWLKANNPFLRQERKQKPHGVQWIRPAADPAG